MEPLTSPLKKAWSADELNTPSLIPPQHAEIRKRQSMTKANNKTMDNMRISPPMKTKRQPLKTAVIMSSKTVRHPRAVFSFPVLWHIVRLCVRLP